PTARPGHPDEPGVVVAVRVLRGAGLSAPVPVLERRHPRGAAAVRDRYPADPLQERLEDLIAPTEVPAPFASIVVGRDARRHDAAVSRERGVELRHPQRGLVVRALPDGETQYLGLGRVPPPAPAVPAGPIRED